ncbi:MAG: hypothetical protein ACFFDO_08155 [Candidatus Thorarchaeota archaeon]
MGNIIVKIGGKILEDSKSLESTIFQFKELLFEKKIINNIVIIPGGGSYANLIRAIDKDLNIGDDLAHWMAIFTMDFNGIKIIKKFPEIKWFKDFNALEESLMGRSISLFLPYDYLIKVDELPHSWDVTSDSIAVFLASKLGLNCCILIKDVNGIVNDQNQLIKEITVNEYKNMKKANRLLKKEINSYKESQPIDTYSLDLIEKYKVSCIILNGKTEKQTIIDFFNNAEREHSLHTKINFS